VFSWRIRLESRQVCPAGLFAFRVEVLLQVFFNQRRSPRRWPAPPRRGPQQRVQDDLSKIIVAPILVEMAPVNPNPRPPSGRSTAHASTSSRPLAATMWG